MLSSLLSVLLCCLLLLELRIGPGLSHLWHLLQALHLHVLRWLVSAWSTGHGVEELLGRPITLRHSSTILCRLLLLLLLLHHANLGHLTLLRTSVLTRLGLLWTCLLLLLLCSLLLLLPLLHLLLVGQLLLLLG